MGGRIIAHKSCSCRSLTYIVGRLGDISISRDRHDGDWRVIPGVEFVYVNGVSRREMSGEVGKVVRMVMWTTRSGL